MQRFLHSYDDYVDGDDDDSDDDEYDNNDVVIMMLIIIIITIIIHVTHLPKRNSADMVNS